MNVDKKGMTEILRLLGNEDIRKVLETITEEKAYNYTMLKKEFNKFREKPKTSFAHYLLKLSRIGLLRSDPQTHTYYLTRIGVQCLFLIKEFEKVCMKYDICDLRADGKIMTIVKERKL